MDKETAEWIADQETTTEEQVRLLRKELVEYYKSIRVLQLVTFAILIVLGVKLLT